MEVDSIEEHALRMLYRLDCPLLRVSNFASISETDQAKFASSNTYSCNFTGAHVIVMDPYQQFSSSFDEEGARYLLLEVSWE